jgi:hypothetical protein
LYFIDFLFVFLFKYSFWQNIGFFLKFCIGLSKNTWWLYDWLVTEMKNSIKKKLFLNFYRGFRVFSSKGPNITLFSVFSSKNYFSKTHFLSIFDALYIRIWWKIFEKITTFDFWSGLLRKPSKPFQRNIWDSLAKYCLSFTMFSGPNVFTRY